VSSIRHHCGLFGIVNHPDAAELTYLGLYAQQHRGQESAGVCTADGQTILRSAGMGLITEAVSQDNLRDMKNPLAIGHVRYSTTGSCSESNVQPLLVSAAMGQAAVCHNGNLVNAVALRKDYERRGRIFTTSSQTRWPPSCGV
jgi:amidophosphoribosyltransferase